ncbi:hypothetical protein AJ87_05010 [Rhizobium yanglingense]|nr:hypothetical protein AJ87_05010 [Rhizobium yanglingense]
MQPDIFFPPGDLVVELPGHVFVDRAAAQQMLSAVDFRGFGKDCGTAGCGQKIGCDAERRIGGNTRKAIRPTALQADDDLADGDRRAPLPTDIGAISRSIPMARSTARREPPAS